LKITLRVKELMDERGWGTDELAREASLDEATAQSVYAEESTEMDMATQGRISQALGVLPHEIVGEVEEPQASSTEVDMPRSDDIPTESRTELKGRGN